MNFFKLSQIIIATLLIIVILAQNRSSGLSGMFGGSNNVYTVKRGIEKILFIATIILGILFFAISISSVIF